MDYEVVRANNYISFSILLDIYIEHQGYKIKLNKLMQDNARYIKWRRMVKIHVWEIPDT